jgi:hypothetical protein
MLSGANAFEISDIQEDEAEAALTRRSGCNHVALGRKWLDGVFGKHWRNNNSPATGWTLNKNTRGQKGAD